MKNIKLKRKILAVAIAAVITGCGAGKNEGNIELIQDLMWGRNLKAQSYDKNLNRPSVRTPPAGTVPRGFEVYKYENDPLAAEARLMNPLKSSPEVLARGQAKFNIYCSVCHGPTGAGDGSVAQYIQAVPALTSDKVKAFRDGRIFHIITAGQGRMLKYSTQITNPEDRWAIVHYIRDMQKGK